jgi:hypothetical protein
VYQSIKRDGDDLHLTSLRNFPQEAGGYVHRGTDCKVRGISLGRVKYTLENLMGIEDLCGDVTVHLSRAAADTSPLYEERG